MKHKKNLKVVCALATLFLSTQASADIQISDTYIDMAGKNNYSLNLKNTGQSIDSYELKMFNWTQESGYVDKNGEVVQLKNNYEETKDIVVFPVNLVLKPEQSNTVRLRYTNAKPLEQNSYRFVLKEIDKKFPNQTKEQAANALSFKLSHRIPVFVNPNSKKIFEMNFEHKFVKIKGKDYLWVKNNDKQPLFLNKITQNDKDLSNAAGYIFSGKENYIALNHFNEKEKIYVEDRYDKKELTISK